MNRAGDAEILHDSLSSDVGSVGPEFFGERRFHEGHPASHSLDLVSWRQHSTVCALDQLASSLAALAASSGPSLLRHSRNLTFRGCHEYIISSRSREPDAWRSRA